MIDASEVTRLFVDCLYKEYEMKDGKPIGDPVIAEGVVIGVGFNPDSLKWNKERIVEIINKLHPSFDEGWSFLNMCMDKENNQWTGLHKTMDELLVMGLAVGKLEYCCDRDMWDVLPGGRPYIRRVKW